MDIPTLQPPQPAPANPTALHNGVPPADQVDPVEALASLAVAVVAAVVDTGVVVTVRVVDPVGLGDTDDGHSAGLTRD